MWLENCFCSYCAAYGQHFSVIIAVTFLARLIKMIALYLNALKSYVNFSLCYYCRLRVFFGEFFYFDKFTKLRHIEIPSALSPKCLIWKVALKPTFIVASYLHPRKDVAHLVQFSCFWEYGSSQLGRRSRLKDPMTAQGVPWCTGTWNTFAELNRQTLSSSRL